MLGYILKWNEWGGRAVRGLILLGLFVPTHARVQAQTPPPTDLPEHAQSKANKKRQPERDFVLVGAAEDLGGWEDSAEYEYVSRMDAGGCGAGEGCVCGFERDYRGAV